MSCDDLLWMCTKINRNNSESLISDSRITKISLMIPLDSWSHQRDSELWWAPHANTTKNPNCCSGDKTKIGY